MAALYLVSLERLVYRKVDDVHTLNIAAATAFRPLCTCSYWGYYRESTINVGHACTHVPGMPSWQGAFAKPRLQVFRHAITGSTQTISKVAAAKHQIGTK